MERIVLASPRGFCAGVAYAIEVVELTLRIHGPPIYVRHAIVHNEAVVRSFEERGVVFVEDVAEIPPGAVVVFSAHGVSPALREGASGRGLQIVDATCPLVTKVHNEAKRYVKAGYFILYIGHRGHVEAEGTMGEAVGRCTLVDGPQEAETVQVPAGEPLAVLTQTTLSVSEVEETMATLKRRFPHLETPVKEDICYATTNRQGAVMELARICDGVIVVGSGTSSNSNRLREVAEQCDTSAVLVMHPSDLTEEWLVARRVVGVTSGASTPESLVEAILGVLLERSPGVEVEILETVAENVEFLPPRNLVQLALASDS